MYVVIFCLPSFINLLLETPDLSRASQSIEECVALVIRDPLGPLPTPFTTEKVVSTYSAGGSCFSVAGSLLRKC